MTNELIKALIITIGTKKDCSWEEYKIQQRLKAQNERGPLKKDFCESIIAEWNALHKEEEESDNEWEMKEYVPPKQLYGLSYKMDDGEPEW